MFVSQWSNLCVTQIDAVYLRELKDFPTQLNCLSLNRHVFSLVFPVPFLFVVYLDHSSVVLSFYWLQCHSVLVYNHTQLPGGDPLINPTV